MRRFLMMAVGLGLTLNLVVAPEAQAQAVPNCDGLTKTESGIKATLTAKKETATSGQTEVTFSLKLKDTKGGHGLSTPEVKTAIGTPATVKAGDEGQPGSVEVTFNPKPLGIPSSVSAKFIDAKGQKRNLNLKCVL